jgi:hypothetical protein
MTWLTGWRCNWIIITGKIVFLAAILILANCAPASTIRPTETAIMVQEGDTPTMSNGEESDVPTISSNPVSLPQSLSGSWKLLSYIDQVTGAVEPEPQDIQRSIILELMDDGENGEIKGHTVTNDVRGEYELFGENQIRVLSFGGTKVAEPPWGQKFWEAISQATSYEITNQSLLISFDDGRGIMEFVPAE